MIGPCRFIKRSSLIHCCCAFSIPPERSKKSLCHICFVVVSKQNRQACLQRWNEAPKSCYNLLLSCQNWQSVITMMALSVVGGMKHIVIKARAFFFSIGIFSFSSRQDIKSRSAAAAVRYIYFCRFLHGPELNSVVPLERATNKSLS